MAWLCLCFVWNISRLHNLWVYTFHQIWKTFVYYSSDIFLYPSCFLPPPPLSSLLQSPMCPATWYCVVGHWGCSGFFFPYLFFFLYLCFTLNNSVSITLSSVLLFFDSVSFAIMYWINTFRCIFHLYKLHLVFLKTSSISLLRSCFLLKLSIWT